MQPPRAVLPTQNRGTAFDESKSRSSGGSRTETFSSGEHEVNVPIHEDFEEISNIMYVSFEEWRTLWDKDVRIRHTGQAFGKFVDDPHVYDLQIQRHAMPATAANEAAVKELLQKNFERELFQWKAHRKHFPQTTLPYFTVLFVTLDHHRRKALAREFAKLPQQNLWMFVSQQDLQPETFLYEPITYNCLGEAASLIKKPQPSDKE